MSLDLSSTLRAVAAFAVLWLAASVLAAVAITRLFRAQARRNDQLAADGRRRDWTDAAGERAETGAEIARR